MPGKGNQDVTILALNSGSSSIKASSYSMGAHESLLQTFQLERIGLADGEFVVCGPQGQQLHRENIELPDHESALEHLFGWLRGSDLGLNIHAYGHRLVHGGRDFILPQRIDEDLIKKLKDLIPLAPDHLPSEILAIEALRRRNPYDPQVACFDTAFHRGMPRVAQVYALPRWTQEAGIERYGFHGLSYEYILQELRREVGVEATEGRLVIAHLGNGASMAAVHGGTCVDTTMGYTPAGGLVMGTRPGDLDPGVVLALLHSDHAHLASLNDLINKESGMLGVSGTSSDMEDLLRREANDPQAAEAVEVFCYQAKKFLGAMISALGGLDTLIFTAGIGENAPTVRTRICTGMEYAGIDLDPARNERNESIISRSGLPVEARVMHTDEDLMIARHTYSVLVNS